MAPGAVLALQSYRDEPCRSNESSSRTSRRLATWICRSTPTWTWSWATTRSASPRYWKLFMLSW